MKRDPTGIMVQPIEVSGLEAKALAYVLEANELRPAISPDATECRAGAKPHGFVETPQGIFALSEEGCGPDYPITKEKPYEIGFYPGRNPQGGTPGWFSTMPRVSIKLGPDDLKALAAGEPVDLAGFIRSFGARLDRNCYSWQLALTKAGAKADKVVSASRPGGIA